MNEEIMTHARNLYEGTHGITMSEVAQVTGIPKRTLSILARDHDWGKALETKTGKSTDAALEAAEYFQRRQTQVVEAREESNEQVKVLAEPLPDERDALLKRHRAEWAAPRAMVVEAARIRDSDPIKAFERAKLAKITADTLKLVQDGERKAHGIDVPVEPGDGKHVIIIERD